jgi:CheY-like chemotaxis protein
MPLRCLLVDDNDAFLKAARNLLERQGMQVAGVASNIAGALRQARALRPDVILVDIGLGEESGFELARLLAAGGQDGQRAQRGRADVILISAQAEADYTDLIAESPTAGFLHKPELSAQRISEILNRQLRVGEPGFQLVGIAIGRLPGRRARRRWTPGHAADHSFVAQWGSSEPLSRWQPVDARGHNLGTLVFETCKPRRWHSATARQARRRAGARSQGDGRAAGQPAGDGPRHPPPRSWPRGRPRVGAEGACAPLHGSGRARRPWCRAAAGAAEVAAYYVVAETLTNAAKHAHASVVHVDVEAADHVVGLRVRDDGRGGPITVHSPVGAGTSLHAEFPIPD